jgi:uncharacterized protein YndB with AHSA1/START domain
MTETGTEIHLRRRIAAPPASVYAYLTDPVLWTRWQGASATIDATPGGTFRMTLENGTTAEGRFVVTEPDRRIVFTWGWVGHPTLPPGSSTVEIELIGDGDATILVLTHRGLPGAEVELHRAGWDHYVPRLTLASEGVDPGPDLPPA